MRPSWGRCRDRDGDAWRRPAPSNAGSGGGALGGAVLGGGD